MKIERLQCFQAVSLYKSFSKAADHLYISQSSLSKHIKALEDELGGALFIRKNNNTVMLSPFGEFISNDINNIIEDYNILMAAAGSYRINHYKKLSIAAPLNVAHSGILTPLTEFEANQGNFFIETMEREHSALRHELDMHHVDICFGYRELLGEPQDYRIVPLFQDPLILVTSQAQAAQHQWKGKLSISALSNIPLCFPREDMEIFSFLINVCRKSGFVPQLTHSDVRLGTIRQYIKTGIRCTLQFESLSRSKFHGDEFVFIALENAPTLTYCMYIEATQTKQMKQRLAEYMLEWFRQNRTGKDSVYNDVIGKEEFEA